MKNKKTIMYCPLNDGHIISEIQNFSQKRFVETVKDFEKDYGKIKLEGTNDLQKMICKLPVVPVTSSRIFSFAKIAVDDENKEQLDTFWETNKMELDKPEIPPSSERELYFVVAALMKLKTKWAPIHKAEETTYTIDAEDSFNKEELDIKGYDLSKVGIALKDDKEVSAYIDLGNNISIRLSDLTAFGSKDLHIKDEKSLYELIMNNNMQYYQKGTLIAPCIEEKLMITNHLKGINWQSEDRLYQVHVESSEALTKLKLNEKGVEARAETCASVRLLVACSATNRPRSYSLTIKHGLVVDIRYRNQSIFVAYIPQERFITE